MSKRIFILLAFLVCLLTGQARADGILLSWSGRDVQGVSEQAFNEAKKLDAEGIVKKNLSVRSWADAYLLAVASSSRKDDRALLSALVSQLSDQTKTPLQGTSRLIIWERITSGEILFEGKGLQIDDDLFSVAGRANWLLRTLTKKNFGHVKPSTTAAQLLQLQEKWKGFIEGKSVDEYKNPFETAETGLKEIRSREALEALIVALQPNQAKDQVTKNCLQRLYKLDKLPEDESSPAALCSPDTLTYRYLAILTDVKDRQMPAWWKLWWDTNRQKLEWKPDQGKFVAKA